MKLEEQVVNRELSQKIDELEIRGESLYAWYKYSFINVKSWWALVPNKGDSIKNISAYTVAELGEILPNQIEDWSLETVKEGIRMFYVAYSGGNWGFDIMDNKCFRDKSEANARAKALIWLKENGYL